jgi:hypothetical protein
MTKLQLSDSNKNLVLGLTQGLTTGLILYILYKCY